MNQARGYTLVEVLVAVLVFAVLAASAYGALDALSRSAIDQREHAEALAGLQLTMARLDSDLRQVTHRAYRNPFGQLEPPLSGTTGGLVATRAGWGNPSAIKRSQLQRFAWQFDNSTLSRLAWPVTDPAAATGPQVDAMDLELNDFRLRFRDPGGAWHDQWPPASGPAPAMPLAVEVQLDTERFGAIRRLLVLAP